MSEDAPREGGGTDYRRIAPGLHPFFRGLLEALPEPGTDWSPAKREQWLETARNIFALIYQDPDDERTPIRLADAPQQTAAPEPRFDERTA